MKIEILGTGCIKCETLAANVEKAIAETRMYAQVEKVEDMERIMAYGIISTPGLVIDGEIKSTGKILTTREIKALF